MTLDRLSLLEIARLTEDEARALIEEIRWPDGPACPRCSGRNVTKVKGGRSGLYRCRDCRKDKKQTRDQFTVTVGTIFEDSHIPLHKWLMAINIMCASKKGVSSLQLKRQLHLGSYKTAWFMAHRIRKAMVCEPLASMLSGVVEVDETFVGGKPRHKGSHNIKYRGWATRKAPVVVMVERNGRARTVAMDRLNHEKVKKAVRDNISPDARLMSDEARFYKSVGREFSGGHGTVKHLAGEYARGDDHVNTAESFNALLKRGIVGAFHHVSKKHLGRYAHEFAFRWDHRKVSDEERTKAALRQAEGRRLMGKDL